MISDCVSLFLFLLYFYAIAYGGSSAGINRSKECPANNSRQNLIGGLRKTDCGRKVLRGATAAKLFANLSPNETERRAMRDSDDVNISTELLSLVQALLWANERMACGV